MEKITLDYPVTMNGEEVKELTIRRPRVRDVQVVESMKKDEFEKTVALIANLSQRTADEIRDLDMSDFRKISDVVNGFLGLRVG
jgi:hypothetical protein